ncbi:succinate dehydrogenase, hydrophobic membrane anchor protein [Paucibacter sp. AS339]|uniref:succinate dehydrogenase, hydrophobic membrane anchor protein n=1 Tax=Paucibacter hankyongi TaxID=3133434 RepID=UPI0030A0CAA1
MKRPLGALQPWLVQRLSAVFMLLFLGFVLVHFLVDPPLSYAAWRAWVSQPAVCIGALLFFAALLMHAWVGLRDVTHDYVNPLGVRVAALALIALALLGVAAWIFLILWPGRA